MAAGVTSVDVIISGSRGADGATDGGTEPAAAGGAGARVYASLVNLPPASDFFLYVGCVVSGFRPGGWGGPGDSGGERGGEGGGSSALLNSVEPFADLILAAGGGGGGGGDTRIGENGGLGGAGGLRGLSGTDPNGGPKGGKGSGRGDGLGGFGTDATALDASGGGGGGAGCDAGGNGGLGGARYLEPGGGGGGGDSCAKDLAPGRGIEIAESRVVNGGNGQNLGQIEIRPNRIGGALASRVIDGDSDGHSAGDEVEYTAILGNTGASRVRQSAAVVTVASAGGSTTQVPLLCPAAEVASGKTAQCTGRYRITQNDLDQGALSATATVSARSELGAPLSSTTQEHATAFERRTEVTASGTAVLSTTEVVRVGASVRYTVVLENKGNTTTKFMNVVGALEERGGQIVLTCDGVRPGEVSLAPGVSTTCVDELPLLQGDIDRGQVSLTVRVNGYAGTESSTLASTRLVTTVGMSPDLTGSTASEIRDVDEDGLVEAGDRIEYRVRVGNPGNVTMRDIRVTGLPTELTGCPNDGTTALLPPADLECTGVYTLTQADVDRNEVVFAGEVSGANPRNGERITRPIGLTTPLAARGAVRISKQVKDVEDTGGDGRTNAGDVITYEVVLTNTGNVTLRDLNLVDTLGGSPLPFSCDPVYTGVLAPGAVQTCTAPYTVTIGDVEAGEVVNVADVGGLTPQDVLVGGRSEEVRTELAQAAALTVTAVVRPSAKGSFELGDEIAYEVTARNSGTAALTSVEMSTTPQRLASCAPPPPADLGVRGVVVCAATHVVSAADVTAGKVVLAATATGTDPGGTRVEATTRAETIVVDRSTTVTTSTAPPSTSATSASGSATTPRVNDSSTPSTSVTGTASGAARGLATTGASVRFVALLGLVLVLAGAGALYALARGRRRSGTTATERHEHAD